MQNSPDMAPTAWTRLSGSPLWRKAEAAYEANGLDYHNMAHIKSLYAWAATLNVPYSLKLDENILGHDIVMNLGPGANERASRDWLLENTESGNGDPSWADLILQTIEHRPSEDETGIAMLDLASFVSPIMSRTNTDLLRAEAIKVRGGTFDEEEWVAGSVRYLEGLAERIAPDLDDIGGETGRIWREILDGVAVTAACMPFAYGFDDASRAVSAALRATGPRREETVTRRLSPWLRDDLSGAVADAVVSGRIRTDTSGRLCAEDGPGSVNQPGGMS